MEESKQKRRRLILVEPILLHHGARVTDYIQSTPRFKVITCKDIRQDFADNTSLIGIRHILKQKSCFWVVAYIACLSMSLVQSWIVAADYLQQKTVLSYTIGSSSSKTFPSVTFCSGVALNEGYNMSLIKGYNNDIESSGCSRHNMPHAADSESTMLENRRNMIKHILDTKESDRIRNSLEISKFVRNCSYDRKPCNLSNPSEFLIFNNPMLGNCFTFNPGLNEKTTKIARGNSGLSLILHVNSSGYVIEGVKHKIHALIHPPGTAPVLDSPSTILVYPKQTLDIGMKLSETSFIKKYWTTPPSCIHANDKKYRQKSFYYKSPKFGYLYSTEACLKSCEQKYFIEKCKVLNPFIPLKEKSKLPFELSYYFNNYNIQPEIPPIECDDVPEIDIKSCDCPLACRYFQYTNVIDTSDLIVPGKCNKTQNSEDEDNENAKKVKILIHFFSSMYEQTEEQFKYTIYEILGIIGGNLSLWIGLCILSLLEVVELAWNMLRTGVRNCVNKPQIVYQQQKTYQPCKCCCHCQAGMKPRIKQTARSRSTSAYTVYRHARQKYLKLQKNKQKI